MSIVRSTISFVLLLAAVALGLSATGARWVDQMARTAEPSEAIIAPIARSPEVSSAVAAELEAMIVAQLPASVDSVPRLRAQLEELIGTSITAVLDNPAIDQAWRSSVSSTRTWLVEDLDRYRSDNSVTPTIWLDLRPFMDLVRTRVLENVPERSRVIVEQIRWGDEFRIAIASPDARQSQLAAEVLGLTRLWLPAYVVAGVLAVLGLAMGSRRGRWIAWILASLAGLAGVLVARAGLGGIELDASSSVRGAVAEAAGRGVVDSLLTWTASVPWLLLTSAVAGMVVLALVSAVGGGRAQARGSTRSS